MTLNKIRAALSQCHPADLPVIRQYVAWVKMRRLIHSHFYDHAHWLHSRGVLSLAEGRRSFHWL